jgi:hypothetical protein
MNKINMGKQSIPLYVVSVTKPIVPSLAVG